MEFIQSSLFSNIIAFLALITSIASIWYTHSQNRYKFSVSDLVIHPIKDYVELNIVIANVSPKSHVLEKIIFLDENMNSIRSVFVDKSELEYLKDGTFNPKYFNNPLNDISIIGELNRPEVVLPFAKLEFSYTFETTPKYIKIVSNKRINKFKKYILISTDSY